MVNSGNGSSSGWRPPQFVLYPDEHEFRDWHIRKYAYPARTPSKYNKKYQEFLKEKNGLAKKQKEITKMPDSVFASQKMVMEMLGLPMDSQWEITEKDVQRLHDIVKEMSGKLSATDSENNKEKQENFQDQSVETIQTLVEKLRNEKNNLEKLQAISHVIAYQSSKNA